MHQSLTVIQKFNNLTVIAVKHFSENLIKQLHLLSVDSLLVHHKKEQLIYVVRQLITKLPATLLVELLNLIQAVQHFHLVIKKKIIYMYIQYRFPIFMPYLSLLQTLLCELHRLQSLNWCALEILGCRRLFNLLEWVGRLGRAREHNTFQRVTRRLYLRLSVLKHVV